MTKQDGIEGILILTEEITTNDGLAQMLDEIARNVLTISVPINLIIIDVTDQQSMIAERPTLEKTEIIAEITVEDKII